MTDVRLTATNPDDSSVVPVACNSRGELLTVEPVIEEIPNDVTINGKLAVNEPANIFQASNRQFYGVSSDQGQIAGIFHGGSGNTHFCAGGYRTETDTWSRYSSPECTSCSLISLKSGTGQITFHTQSNKPEGDTFVAPVRMYIDDTGPGGFDFRLSRPDDTRSWSESISVFEELLFLRDQMRSLLERLKMAPEGGWEVWDGTD